VKEEMRDFCRRVFNATGVLWEELPWGTFEDLRGGRIIARRGRLFVVALGHPDEDDDGNEVYHAWRRVVM
jgi:hypothetical protein